MPLIMFQPLFYDILLQKIHLFVPSVKKCDFMGFSEEKNGPGQALFSEMAGDFFKTIFWKIIARFVITSSYVFEKK